MPELILLSVVSLTAMGLLVFLFLKLNQSQLAFIKHLTVVNQSLVNQVRSKDITALQGLMQVTGITSEAPEDHYTTVEDREMAAYRESASHAHELGEFLMDDELAMEMAEMREEL